jgi:NADH dehydrogenase [ubiquinone] 1 alpha subcomplex assembly factor 7
MPAPAPPVPRDDLRSLIAAEIRRSGPIPIARFMSLALGHPELGYYRRHDPFGAAGDFTSAPEISQMFGEVIGLWLAQAWLELGSPSPVRLIELGPGRGTMMSDMLRAVRAVPGLSESVEVHLVETSPKLQALQRERLRGAPVSWHVELEDVPPGPLLLVANEFFDALPVHQLVLTGRGWVERGIGLAPDGGLAFVAGAEPSPLAQGLDDASDVAPGTVAEVSPARAKAAAAIGRRLAEHGGLALLIDYGAWAARPTGDTLQAVRKQAPCEPLETPGEVDLSSHVDFRPLAAAAAAAGAAVFGPVPQGTFLRALGIEARAARLVAGADAEQAHAIRQALFRLTDASAMGELFKALALAGPRGPAPPGFSREVAA